MKKLLILLILSIHPIIGFSAIDECKTDVYFANGILTEDEDARKYARDILKPAIITKLSQEKKGTGYFKLHPSD